MHTKGVVQRLASKKGSPKVLETRFEKVLRRVLRRCLQWVLKGGRVLRRVLRRGSKKGLSRRHTEGRNMPFRRVRPPSHTPERRTGTVGTIFQELNKKRSTKNAPIVFALFRLFSFLGLVFNRFRAFSLVFALGNRSEIERKALSSEGLSETKAEPLELRDCETPG